MSESFEQLYLGDIERGLAKSIAVLALEPKDITKKTGIKFEITKDDLDYLDAALIRSSSHKQYGLIRHHHAPFGGVEIVTNEKSQTLANDLDEVLNILGLAAADLNWITPEIK
ncbi:MAG: hypothetical protein WCD79_08270 [Chthoniobacteraceae bacterium]